MCKMVVISESVSVNKPYFWREFIRAWFQIILAAAFSCRFYRNGSYRNEKLKVVIIGKSGQLANELMAEVPKHIQVIALGRDDVDITSMISFTQVIEQNNPSVIINASAYTAVDKAETDIDAAYALNKTAVEIMATVAKSYDIRLLHVSTDFVFDGQSNKAYGVNSSTNPLGVYGESKLAGETAITNLHPENSAIVRTSWLYSSFGNNFVKTMLRLMKEKDELGVVADQIGCPAYAKTLATFLWKLAELDNLASIYHWSDAGVASWYDFAKKIQLLAIEQGLLDNKIPIKAIPSSAYPTSAKRPSFSLLDTTEAAEILMPVYCREQLANCLSTLKEKL